MKQQDPIEKLHGLGVVLAVLAALMVFGHYVTVQTVAELDRHGGERAERLEEKLERQEQALADLTGEVRRLQDQRRTADELKAALRDGLASARAAAPQPVYVPVAPGAPAAAQPAPAQPAPAGPPAPVEAPAETTSAPDTDGEAFAGTGTGEDVPGPDPKAMVGGTFVQTATEPSTLNYYTTTEGRVRTIMRNVIESMFDLSEQDPTKLEKLLATGWTVSDDKLTITYDLRQGVTWSDGAPFTSADVVFTYQVLMDPNVESEGHRGDFQDIESVTADGPHRVRVKFKKRYWKGLYVFGQSLLIIPQHWYAKKVKEVGEKKRAEDASFTFSTEPGKPGFGTCFNEIHEPCVGTGPYKMAPGGWDRGKSLTFVRNAAHWRFADEPGVWNLETFRWRFISDHTQQLNQTRQQKIDIVVVKKDEWLDSLQHEKPIRDNYEYQNYDHIGLGFNYIAYNCRTFPFDDARVRRAMTHLVDRKGLLRDLWRNNGVVATCPNKPIYPEYNQEIQPLEFDPAKAAALLKEAGFVDHDGDGILDKEVNGEWKPFSFTFKVPSGISEYVKIGSHLQENCRKVGVDVKIGPLEWATFIQDLYKHEFEACSLYEGPSDAWIDNYSGLHSSEDKHRGGNLPGLRMPEIDQLLEQAREEYDREKRVPIYHRLYEILHEQQPRTLLIHGRVNVLVHKRFRNIKIRHKGMRSTYWWVHPEDRIY
jgi:peptide/nickel transport system substrate-binding protein